MTHPIFASALRPKTLSPTLAPTLWLTLLLAAVGCGEEETAKQIGPKPDAAVTADTSQATDVASAGDAAGGTDAQAASDAAAPDAVSDAGQTDDASASTDATAGSDAVSCEGPGGCWSCAPTTSLQILNQCNDLVSVPFDNKARLPLLPADGKLPPVP